MPITKRPYKKRAYKKRAPYRRRPMVARKFSQPEYASCSETLQKTFSTDQMNFLLTTNLSAFPRARDIAANYQHFRITGLELRLRPKFDSFDAAGGQQCPYVLYQIDKSGSIPSTVNPATLRSMGAKQIRFDGKTISVKWRPSVLLEAGGSVASGDMYKISPWLQTSSSTGPILWTPSIVDHLGVVWDVITGLGTPYQLDYELVAHFQFKKPLFEPVPSPGGEVVIANRINLLDN